MTNDEGRKKPEYRNPNAAEFGFRISFGFRPSDFGLGAVIMSDVQPISSRPAAWLTLRRFTPARVALGRVGGSLPTAALLDFRLAHARARDALLRPLDERKLASALESASGEAVLRLESAARNFDEYLLRPDSGRELSGESVQRIQRLAPDRAPDLALIVSEGLSALAVETHAADVLRELLPRLRAESWRLGPICLVRRARVALEDHLGGLL